MNIADMHANCFTPDPELARDLEPDEVRPACRCCKHHKRCEELTLEVLKSLGVKAPEPCQDIALIAHAAHIAKKDTRFVWTTSPRNDTVYLLCKKDEYGRFCPMTTAFNTPDEALEFAYRNECYLDADACEWAIVERKQVVTDTIVEPLLRRHDTLRAYQEKYEALSERVTAQFCPPAIVTPAK